MKTTIHKILEPYRNKIGISEFYETPINKRNDWIGSIKNCIAYMEILQNGSDEISLKLRKNGYIVQQIGRELYITK